MRNSASIFKNLDITTVLVFYLIVLIGWFSIHAAIYTPADDPGMFDLDNRAGRQILWIFCSMIIGTIILLVDYRFWLSTPVIFYGIILVLLVVVLFTEGTNGATSWIAIGPFKLQPSEFAKVTTALLVAKYMDENRVKIGLNNKTFITTLIILIPTLLILIQNETGTVLVFTCFVLVLYREGLTYLIPLIGIWIISVFITTLVIGTKDLSIGLITGSLLLIGSIFLFKKPLKYIFFIIAGLLFSIAIMFGTDFFVEKVLKDHQRVRVYAWLNPDAYTQSYAWQTTNARTAIGHGGFTGTGHLKGDITQLELVPEQFTDFILCTIGEEHGWLGILIAISIYTFMMIKILLIAERQKAVFARVYGYSTALIIFFHFMINIGMEIGFLPVIGIPLPMLSYGGSSLWAFTILVFILLKFDMHRGEILARA